MKKEKSKATIEMLKRKTRETAGGSLHQSNKKSQDEKNF